MSEQLVSRVETLGNGAALVRLSGEIDLATAPMVVDQFGALADQGLSNLIIDMTAITFIDSSGINALVEGKRIIHERGSRLVLVPSPAVSRLFDLAFGGQVFATRAASVEEAMMVLFADSDDEDV